MFLGVFVGVLFFGKIDTYAASVGVGEHGNNSGEEINYELNEIYVDKNNNNLYVKGWFYMNYRNYFSQGETHSYSMRLVNIHNNKSIDMLKESRSIDHTDTNRLVNGVPGYEDYAGKDDNWDNEKGFNFKYSDVGFTFRRNLTEIVDTLGEGTYKIYLKFTVKADKIIKGVSSNSIEYPLMFIGNSPTIACDGYNINTNATSTSSRLYINTYDIFVRTPVDDKLGKTQRKESNKSNRVDYGGYLYYNHTTFTQGSTLFGKAFVDSTYNSWYKVKVSEDRDAKTLKWGKKAVASANKSGIDARLTGVGANYENNPFTMTVSRKKYTYTFNANGGNYSGSETMAKVYGIPFVFENVTPTRTGYTFRGWKAVHNGKEYSPSTGWDTNPGKRVPHLPSNNITWYAQWEINQYEFDLNATLDENNIQWLSNFGTADIYVNGSLVGNDVNDWTKRYNYGTTVEVKDINAKPGYTYTGNRSYSYTLGSYTDCRLPFTTNTYTIQYNGNGNTGGSTASSSHRYNEAKNLTPNGFTKTGYEFTGWNTEADGSGTSYRNGQSVINLTTKNKDVVNLYAQWKAKKYTVTIKPNRGILKGTNFGTSNNTSNDAKVTVTYDSTNYWSLGTASRKHYTFLGFYTSYDKNNANVNGVGTKVWDSAGKSTVSKYFNANKVWKYDGNLTVYANWYNYKPTITQPILPSNNSTVKVPSNIPPFISGGAVVIQKGDPFNPSRFFDYSDKETPKNELKVTIKNPVPLDKNGNTTTKGTYTVTVTVSDGAGASVSTNLKVIVNDPPVLKAKDRWFYTGETVGVSQILEKVTATDYEDGNIKSKVQIVSIKDVNGTNTGSTTKIDTSKIGKYVVTYKVTDKYKKSVTTTATFNVTTLDTDTPSSWYDIRYISKKYLGTVEGQWSSGTLFKRLKTSLNKKATDSNALYVIEMDSNTVENMKKYIVGELSSGNSNRILNLNDNIYSKYKSIFKKKPADGGTRKY